MTITHGMSPTEVRQLAQSLDTAAGRIEAITASVDKALIRARWEGKDAQDFQNLWRNTLKVRLREGNRSLESSARELKRQADDQERTSSDTYSLVAGILGGIGASTLTTLLLGPGGSGLAPFTAGLAALYFRGIFTPGSRVDEDLQREGDRSGNQHFQNDWAGREILAHYLAGGDDLDINNDPKWTQYMQDIDGLKNGFSENGQYYPGMAERAEETAQQAVANYLSHGQSDGKFDENFPMVVTNGEGIVGENYLHGTNANAGGFERSGTTHVEELPNGNYRVTMDVNYTWNDVIDPNPDYTTDVWKSTLAEIITLGRADPYDISISWDSNTTVEVSPDGKVVSMSGGWPA